MKKQKRSCIIFLILIFLCFSTGCGAWQAFGKTELPKIKTQKELYEFVENKLKSGEKEIKLYLSKDIAEDDLAQLNQHIDGYYGGIKEYSYRNSLTKGYYNVSLYAEFSDNFYAERIISGKISKSETTKRAAKLADKAKNILQAVIKEDMTDYEKEKAIHDYIVSCGEYGYIKGKDNAQSYRAYGILVKGKGVCQAYAEATQLLLRLAGVKSRMIVGIDKEKGENHAWNLVKLDGEWYHLDVTWDDPTPDKEGRVLYTYFNLDDEQMAKDHEWDTNIYPEAKGETYHYYKEEGIYFETQEEAEEYIKDLVLTEHATVMDFMVGDYTKEKYGEEWGSFLWSTKVVKSISYEKYGNGKRIAFRFYVGYRD